MTGILDVLYSHLVLMFVNVAEFYIFWFAKVKHQALVEIWVGLKAKSPILYHVNFILASLRGCEQRGLLWEFIDMVAVGLLDDKVRDILLSQVVLNHV